MAITVVSNANTTANTTFPCEWINGSTADMYTFTTHIPTSVEGSYYGIYKGTEGQYIKLYGSYIQGAYYGKIPEETAYPKSPNALYLKEKGLKV